MIEAIKDLLERPVRIEAALVPLCIWYNPETRELIKVFPFGETGPVEIPDGIVCEKVLVEVRKGSSPGLVWGTIQGILLETGDE